MRGTLSHPPPSLSLFSSHLSALSTAVEQEAQCMPSMVSCVGEERCGKVGCACVFMKLNARAPAHTSATMSAHTPPPTLAAGHYHILTLAVAQPALGAALPVASRRSSSSPVEGGRRRELVGRSASPPLPPNRRMRACEGTGHRRRVAGWV